MDLDPLGNDLRQRRRRLGLTQAEVADLAGVSERFVRLLEGGKSSVRMDKLVAVLDVLGLELHASIRKPTTP